MAAKQYDTLELGEQQEPLAAPEPRGRSFQFRGKALIAAGALLLGAAGLALALSRASAAKAPAPAGVLAETIQGYALGEVGRPLRANELAVVQASVAAKLRKVHARALIGGVRPRWLEDSDSEAGVCLSDMKEYFKDLIKKIMTCAIQTASICAASNGQGHACNAAKRKMDNLEDEEKDARRAEGTLCEMKVITPKGGVKEEDELYIPPSCKGHLDTAEHFLSHDVKALIAGKDLDEDHDHDDDEEPSIMNCQGCTAKIHCGEGDPDRHHGDPDHGDPDHDHDDEE